jgi:hypothetical protein
MHHFVYEAAPDSTLAIASEFGEPIVATGAYGKGRIVALAYHNYGLLPFVEKEAYGRVSEGYWEYVWSLLCRSIVWAAARDPVLTLEAVSISPGLQVGENSFTVSAELKNRGAERNVSVQLYLRDEAGNSITQDARRVSVSSSGTHVEFVFDQLLLDGGTLLTDLILSDPVSGATLDWGSKASEVFASCGISELTIASEPVNRGDVLRGAVEVTNTQPEAKLIIRLIDSYDRLVDQIELPSRGGSFQLRTDSAGSRMVWVEAVLYDQGRAGDRKRRMVLIVPPRDRWDDYEVEMRMSPYFGFHPPWRATMHEQLKGMGVTIMDDPTSTFKIVYRNPRKWERFDPEGLYTYLESPYNPIRERYAEKKRQYADTGSKHFLVREPCLSSPRYAEDLASNCRRIAEKYKQFGAIWYDICNESSITYYGDAFGFCFSHHCMDRFRSWLQQNYGSLDALNGQWRTDFNSWDEVVPYTLREARAKNAYSSWADHRSFMEEVFTSAVGLCEKAIHDIDPGIPVGLTNSNRTSVYSGYDYYLMAQRSGLSRKSRGWIYGKSFRNDYRWFGASGYSSTGAQAGYQIWYGLIHDHDQATSNYWHWWNLSPDLTYTDQSRSTKDSYLELTRGIGKAFVNADRTDAQVVFHYSLPSYHGAYAVDGEVSGEVGYWPAATSKTFAEFEKNEASWQACLDDLGIPYDFLAKQQLEKGLLDVDHYRILVLPMSLAISEEEAEAITDFVRDGGTVIADDMAGLMDGHSQPLDAGALDELFGIRQQPLLRSDDRIPAQNQTADRMEAPSGIPAGEAQMFIKQSGNGRAIYLNRLLSSYQDHGPAFRQLIEKLMGEAGVSPPVRMRAPGGEVIEGAFCMLYERAPLHYLGVILAADQESSDFTLDLKDEYFVHDLRSGEKLGKLRQVSGMLQPGEAKAYSLLPYDVQSISIDLPPTVFEPGDRIQYEVRLEGDGTLELGDHVFRIEVMDPSGEVVEAHTGNRLSVAGVSQEEVGLALNAQKGSWRIVVRDITSGLSNEVLFQVR